MDNKEFEKTFSSIKRDMEADEESTQLESERTIPNRTPRQAQGRKKTNIQTKCPRISP